MSREENEGQMTAEEMASLMGVPTPKPIEENRDEAMIYLIAGRIKNHVALDAMRSVGPQQQMLCNTFAHMLKSFYDFALKMPDSQTKTDLLALIKKQESVPAELISAIVANVKVVKKEEEITYEEE